MCGPDVAYGARQCAVLTSVVDAATGARQARLWYDVVDRGAKSMPKKPNCWYTLCAHFSLVFDFGHVVLPIRYADMARDPMALRVLSCSAARRCPVLM
eukprot:1264681-Rhodomonas_salina.3